MNCEPTRPLLFQPLVHKFATGDAGGTAHDRREAPAIPDSTLGERLGPGHLAGPEHGGSGMAGSLALSVLAACVTAIVVTDRQAVDPVPAARPPRRRPDDVTRGLLSFASPTASGPRRRADKSTRRGPPPRRRPTATSPATHAPDAKGSSAPPGVSAARPRRTRREAADKPPAPRHAERSGPSGGQLPRPLLARAATAGEARSRRAARNPARTPPSTWSRGLSDSSCYSFATHDGRYLRHRDFVLRADCNDGSSLFQQDATFCPRVLGVSPARSLLQSVNYPNYALRHRNFQLRLDPYGYNTSEPGRTSLPAWWPRWPEPHGPTVRKRRHPRPGCRRFRVRCACSVRRQALRR